MLTASRVWSTGIVWPAFSGCREVPFSSSRYFRPIAETDCTIALVFGRQRFDALFELQAQAIALTRPVLGFLMGRSGLTSPTRAPAMRTWFEGITPEASLSSTLMLYVGTNGSPLLAL